MFGDYANFYRYGLALREGAYIGPYPLPVTAVFALLTYIPPVVDLAVLVSLSIAILVYLFKREALLWIFYVPILETFALGQLSLIWLAMLRRNSALSFAVLTLKPSLFPLAIPALIKHRELWRPFASWIIVLYLPSIIIRPMWPIEWAHRLLNGYDRRITPDLSASLWAMPLLALACAALLIYLRRAEWQMIFTAYNPTLLAYDYTLLAGASLWLIPLSWLIFGVMQLTQADWPMAFVGIAAALLERGKNHEHRSIASHPGRGVFRSIRLRRDDAR